MYLFSKKTLPCTFCNQPVPLFRFYFITEAKEFPDGAYEAKCPKCGAVFIYSADYVKEVLKGGVQDA